MTTGCLVRQRCGKKARPEALLQFACTSLHDETVIMHAQKKYKSDTHTWACVLNYKKTHKKQTNRQAQRFKIPPKPFLGKLKVQYKIR